MKELIILTILVAAGVCLLRCSPEERQQVIVDASKVAVHAAALDLIVFCQPTDTVEACLTKLLDQGIQTIILHQPKDAGDDR